MEIDIWMTPVCYLCCQDPLYGEDNILLWNLGQGQSYHNCVPIYQGPVQYDIQGWFQVCSQPMRDVVRYKVTQSLIGWAQT